MQMDSRLKSKIQLDDSEKSEMENNNFCIDLYTFDIEIKCALAPMEFICLMKDHYKKKKEGFRKSPYFQRSLFPSNLTFEY